MKINMNNLYIKLFEFANKYPQGFNYPTLIKEVSLEEWEIKITQQYLSNACKNHDRSGGTYPILESPFITTYFGGDYYGADCKYTLSYDAYFDYLDYIELKEARKWSVEAKIQSKKAIAIAIWTLVISIILSIFSITCSIWQINSSVRINQNQFNDIVGLIK